MELGHYEKSLELYQKALKLKSESSESKESLEDFEPRFNILFIKWKLGEEAKSLASDFEVLKKALGEQASKPQIQLALNHWESVIHKKEKLNKDVLNSFYGALYSQQRIEKLIKQKQYAEALALLPSKLEDANIVFQLQKDMLTSLVLPKENKNLLCASKLKKYPKSISYTMQVCKYLLDKKSVSLEKIEKQLHKESKRRFYWVAALKDLP